jgi:hypothetical protein
MGSIRDRGTGGGTGVHTAPRRRVRAAVLAAGALAVSAAALALAAGAQPVEPRLFWGADYARWSLVTGYFVSDSHDNRWVRVGVSNPAAAAVYRENAERIRTANGEGLRAYPVGSILSMESFERTADFKVGARGPVFFMRKEPPGFDPDGGDWRYGMLNPDNSLIVDGKDRSATLCRRCHGVAIARDFVFSKDR